MSKLIVTVEHVPSLSGEVCLPMGEMQIKLMTLPLVWRKIKLSDYSFYAPAKWEDWRKIIDYLLPRIPPLLS